MLNMWDNIDGTIERGYAGYSFLYEKGEICVNERTRDFARLLASAGINAIAINNVNVRDGAEWLITERHRENLKALAEVFAEYGVSMYLCIDFAAPMTIDGLSLSDPLDTQVRQWWKDKAGELFTEISNLGGFLVKADSEGRPGPLLMAEITQTGRICWQKRWRLMAVRSSGGALSTTASRTGEMRRQIAPVRDMIILHLWTDSLQRM